VVHDGSRGAGRARAPHHAGVQPETQDSTHTHGEGAKGRNFTLGEGQKGKDTAFTKRGVGGLRLDIIGTAEPPGSLSDAHDNGGLKSEKGFLKGEKKKQQVRGGETESARAATGFKSSEALISQERSGKGKEDNRIRGEPITGTLRSKNLP